MAPGAMRCSLPLPNPVNNLAIKGLALAQKNKGNRILFYKIEHYSIMLQADFLKGLGFEVEFVKVDTDGLIDMADLKKR